MQPAPSETTRQLGFVGVGVGRNVGSFLSRASSFRQGKPVECGSAPPLFHASFLRDLEDVHGIQVRLQI